MKEIFDVLDSHGGFTGQTATRNECHSQGLWHRAIVVFIASPDGKKVLLQKRSQDKRLWPNRWDVAVGGHVDAGEFGYQAAIREAKEELGINLQPQDLLHIGSSTSENIEGDIINRHFNDYFITHLDLDPTKLTLQPEEVSEVKWINLDEFEHLIARDTTSITDKPVCWQYYLHYLQPQNLSTHQHCPHNSK